MRAPPSLPATGKGRGREHGFALLIVLWTLVLLSLLVTQLLAAGRVETQLARNLRANAVVEAAANAAVQEAIFRLLDRSAQRWNADNLPRRLALPGAIAEIRIEDQSGKVNPNYASPELVMALLVEVGADPRAAAGLAAAIQDWRTPATKPRPAGAKAAEYAAAGRRYGPPGSDFQSLDELGAVLGMTPAILARLAPHLSIYTDGDPDIRVADPVVAKAMERVAEQGDSSGSNDGGVRVVLIEATVAGPDRARRTQRAIVRINGGSERRPFEILTWESEGERLESLPRV
jgi:general secretion pathway protein K